ncbi:hypothetical protein HOK021_05870 [Streptomyces hygroscopicus]|nr:hypothetical protein HOK021_05870 [Streptomyces hygroscopicus]
MGDAADEADDDVASAMNRNSPPCSATDAAAVDATRADDTQSGIHSPISRESTEIIPDRPANHTCGWPALPALHI